MFQNLKFNSALNFAGVIICTAKLILDSTPDFETLAALFLFIVNQNAAEIFVLYQRKIAQKTEQKNTQVADKLMQLEDEVRKMNLAMNVKGIIRS